ncbi:calmodulin-binding protein 25-like [Primulina eburnea]|uniref:calmodulin-binding protein 25-like n=1 Tax=Primulina eburnea TaxID=1245227 RepID=UPI003C6BF331
MEQLWQIHPTFGDYLIQDIFAMETETLTKALEKSFAGSTHPSYAEDLLSAEMVESFFSAPDTTPVPTPTPSGGSENETPFSRTRRTVAPSGRVAKRKSRATKQGTTTFITADVSNFRQMVQQLTGGSFGGMDGSFPVAPVLKPVPYTAMNRLQTCGSLPTLDSSAFPLEGPSTHLPPPPAAAADGGAPAARLQFDSFGGFPTLESWKVM